MEITKVVLTKGIAIIVVLSSHTNDTGRRISSSRRRGSNNNDNHGINDNTKNYSNVHGLGFRSLTTNTYHQNPEAPKLEIKALKPPPRGTEAWRRSCHGNRSDPRLRGGCAILCAIIDLSIYGRTEDPTCILKLPVFQGEQT